MNSNHLTSVLFSLFLYVILALSNFGWGKAFAFVISPRDYRQESVPITFSVWIGWAVTLFVFQLIHFAFPINFLSVSPVYFFGIFLTVGFIFFQYGRGKNKAKKITSNLMRVVVLCAISVLLILTSVWITSRSMLPPSNYDSGLYHLDTIRWINSFPIIPGLGNLHGRLAFNQSFFHYVAALNLHPLFGHGRSIFTHYLVMVDQ